MPSHVNPRRITPTQLAQVQARLSYGPATETVSPLWPDGPAGTPPDLGREDPQAWGPWISKTCNVFFYPGEMPENPRRVAFLLLELVGHPNEPGKMPGPSWAYSIVLDENYFPHQIGFPARFSGARSFLIDTLSYYLITRP